MIIFILGVTGSGKTTTAKKLGENLGCDCVSADSFYDFIGHKYNIKDYDRFCNPINWCEIPTMEEERVNWYKAKQPKGRTLIVEGATPVYSKALKGILKGLNVKKEECLFIHLAPHNWVELFVKKHGSPPSPMLPIEYEGEVKRNLKGCEVVKIEDVNYLGSPLLYQREGFTNIKWEKLNIGDLSDKTVLDLGCNAGWFSKYSFKQGAKAYTGVDNQLREIIHARHLFNGEFIRQDIEEFLDGCIKEGRTFDVCIMASTLHYFNNKETIIEKISQITKEFVLEIPVSQEEGIKEVPKEGQTYTIPTVDLVKHWLSKYFKESEEVGESIPPDGSFRLVFKGK